MILIYSSRTNVVIVFTFWRCQKPQLLWFFHSEKKFAIEKVWFLATFLCAIDNYGQGKNEIIERNWKFYNKFCVPDKQRIDVSKTAFSVFVCNAHALKHMPRTHSQYHEVFSGLPMDKLWLIIKL